MHMWSVQVALQGPIPEGLGTLEGGDSILKHVEIEDDEEEMIIDHFESSSAFIRDCVTRKGSIVVVCAQGVSRSVSLVLAYMMQYPDHDDGPQTLSKCLATLREEYPNAHPNQGFVQQLETWYEMKFRYDMTHETYRSLCARKTARLVRSQGDEFDMKTLQVPNESIPGTSYRCRSCRTCLATSYNIMVDVSVGTGKEGFSWRKRAKDALQKQKSHSDAYLESHGDIGSIFVEPLRWMSGITENNQGKLYCPGCSARLGSYSWSGMQNEVSEWITPAFQLHASKIDMVPRQNNVVDYVGGCKVSIHQPKLLGRTPRQRQNHPTACHRNQQHIQKKPLYLIFDCDGVLVDSERASCESLRRSILEVTGFDIPHSFPEDFVPVFGMDVESCLEYYMKTYPLSENPFRSAVPASGGWMKELAHKVSVAKKPQYESITSGGIDPIEGAMSLMKNACSTCIHPRSNIPLVAIASSGSHAKIRHNLTSADLWGIVDPEYIVSAQEVERGKPHPDVYLKALDKLHCTSPDKDAIVIEDSIHGIHAAALAGVGHIAAMTTSLSHRQMRNALCSLSSNELKHHSKRSEEQGTTSGQDPQTPWRIDITPTCTVSIIGSTLPSTFEKLVQLLGFGSNPVNE